ncbi:hypothetical protein P8452_60583 [Trifolium repens]|nr:hypothetical protein P8452_60583 [Trifolium repens]
MAIKKIFGTWEDSYAALPQWLTTLRYYQPNVIDILETLPNNSGPGLIFHRLFWSFEPLVKGFRFCKPLVQVDGTWLYGKYRGTLLLAVAQDGNNHIFPVAFAIVEDRHPSIKSAYENPQNGWTANTSTHVYCIRHSAQNFMREIKDKKHRKFVVNMGYAINRPTFAYYHNEIAALNDKELKWGIRNEPITTLVQSTLSVELFQRRGAQSTAVLQSGQEYTEACQKRIAYAMLMTNTHRVSTFDR